MSESAYLTARPATELVPLSPALNSPTAILIAKYSRLVRPERLGLTTSFGNAGSPGSVFILFQSQPSRFTSSSLRRRLRTRRRRHRPGLSRNLPLGAGLEGRDHPRQDPVRAPRLRQLACRDRR